MFVVSVILIKLNWTVKNSKQRIPWLCCWIRKKVQTSHTFLFRKCNTALWLLLISTVTQNTWAELTEKTKKSSPAMSELHASLPYMCRGLCQTSVWIAAMMKSDQQTPPGLDRTSASDPQTWTRSSSPSYLGPWPPPPDCHFSPTDLLHVHNNGCLHGPPMKHLETKRSHIYMQTQAEKHTHTHTLEQLCHTKTLRFSLSIPCNP